MELEQRITELEEKLSFQEDMLDTLNEVVQKQSKDLEDLWAANRLLKQSFNELKSRGTETAAEPPPPHY